MWETIKKIGISIFAAMGIITMVMMILGIAYVYRYCTTLGISLF